MIHAEWYLFWNAALCTCCLPLGGKLAGLPAPSFTKLGRCGLIVIALGPFSLFTNLFRSFALLGLPLCVWNCFGQRGIACCIRATLTTLCASFLLGGTVECLLTGGMTIVPSLVLAMMLVMGLYLLATLLPASITEVRQIELCHEGRSVLLPAMLDSGNLLRDPITGLPVVVVPQKAVMHTLFPFAQSFEDRNALPMGFRLLSVRTATGSALMPMFHPEKCKMYLDGKACEVDLLVAVGGKQYAGVQALVPTAALAGKG